MAYFSNFLLIFAVKLQKHVCLACFGESGRNVLLKSLRNLPYVLYNLINYLKFSEEVTMKKFFLDLFKMEMKMHIFTLICISNSWHLCARPKTGEGVVCTTGY